VIIMANIHPLEPHLLSLLPEGWPVARGHRLRPAHEYRTWLTALRDAGDDEATVYFSGRPPRSGLCWFAPGIPMIYVGKSNEPAERPHVYRLPLKAALEAADFSLVEYLPHTL